MVEVGDGKILHSPVPFLQHLQLPCREVIYGSFIQSVTHLGSVEEGRKGQAATTREWPVDHREIYGIFIGNVDGIYEINGINGI